MIALMISTFALADCDATTTTAQLSAVLGDAELAYSNLDLDSFDAAMERAEQILPCLSDPISRHMAATTHRFVGLRAFFSRDLLSTRAFAASRAIEPNYRFPQTLVPPGNPVLLDYNQLNIATGSYATVPPPKSGWFQLDGARGDQRPLNWPTVLQQFNASGEVIYTDYLRENETLPPYEVAASASIGPSTPHVSALSHKMPAFPLLVGAGVAALASGALYTTAAVTRARYNNTDTPYQDLGALRKSTNTLATASGVTGAISLGLGVGVALTW